MTTQVAEAQLPLQLCVGGLLFTFKLHPEVLQNLLRQNRTERISVELKSPFHHLVCYPRSEGLIRRTKVCGTINIFIPDDWALSRNVQVEPSEEEEEQEQKLCCSQEALHLKSSGPWRAEPAELLRVICREQRKDQPQTWNGDFLCF